MYQVVCGGILNYKQTVLSMSLVNTSYNSLALDPPMKTMDCLFFYNFILYLNQSRMFCCFPC